jgi:acyl transferase domain-containing protein
MELLSNVELDPPIIERRTCELVISGVSCRLPESENMEEFEQHLMDGDDMVSDDSRRWKPGIF